MNQYPGGNPGPVQPAGSLESLRSDAMVQVLPKILVGGALGYLLTPPKSDRAAWSLMGVAALGFFGLLGAATLIGASYIERRR